MTFSGKFVRPKDLKNTAAIGGLRQDNEPVLVCLAGCVNDRYNTDVNTKDGTLRSKSFTFNPTKAKLSCKSNCSHNSFST
jgi:hypothetical protein